MTDQTYDGVYTVKFSGGFAIVNFLGNGHAVVTQSDFKLDEGKRPFSIGFSSFDIVGSKVTRIQHAGGDPNNLRLFLNALDEISKAIEEGRIKKIVP